MKRNYLIIIFIAIGLIFSSSLYSGEETIIKSKKLLSSGTKDKIVLIKTTFGDIKIKLYNETPIHRDNFIKLVSEGFYDSLLFHRVINDFMIQGGDPDSKNAKPEQRLGNGGPGYTLPAEFNPNLFHKKGALAAAREGDNVNPEKRSSGSQYYIAQGKVYTAKELEVMAERQNQQIKVELIREFITQPENSVMKSDIEKLQKEKKYEEVNKIVKEIEFEIQADYDKADKFEFTEKQIEMYTTIGGTPHLDGAYTVFGEVIEGLDVIDKIATVKVDESSRPLENVIMTIIVID